MSSARLMSSMVASASFVHESPQNVQSIRCSRSRLISPGSISLRNARNARVSTIRRSCSSLISCKAKNLTQEEFDDAVLKSDLPVLVDFWAEWCGPCKLVAPIIDWVAENYAGKLEVYKMNTEQSPGLVEKYKIYGLPTLIMFRDGKVVPGSHREGAITKAKLINYLEELLPSVAA